MNRIITAKDIALRDNFPSVHEWVRVTSIQLKIKGGCPVAFSGNVAGKPNYAYISNGRWMGVCDEPGCMGCEYVDPVEPIFFCMTCGNGQSGKARPVKFPKDWREIEKAMLERVMLPGGGNDDVTKAFNARPLDKDLRRDWLPSQLKNMYEHPSLFRRVIVDSYGDSAETVRKKTNEIRTLKASQHAS